MGLSVEKTVGTGRHCPQSKYVKKQISRQTLGNFSIFNFIQTFD